MNDLFGKSDPFYIGIVDEQNINLVLTSCNRQVGNLSGFIMEVCFCGRCRRTCYYTQTQICFIHCNLPWRKIIYTNRDGYYHLENMPYGKYRVIISDLNVSYFICIQKAENYFNIIF